MKIFVFLIAFLYMQENSLASCMKKTKENISFGIFEVVHIEAAGVRCIDKNNREKKSNAPGCLAHLRRIGNSTLDQNQKNDFLYYGGDKSCSYKIGEKLELKMSDYCCGVLGFTSCDIEHPVHSDMMWACHMKAWYNSEKRQFEEFPNDFRGTSSGDTSNKGIPISSQSLFSKIYDWFSDLF